MSILEDWINALSKPADSLPIEKEINRWNEINESLKRGDYISKVDFKDSPIEQQLEELQKLRQDFDKYRTDQAAYQTAAEHREKVAGRKGFWYGILSGIITTIIGSLVVYYWPAIVEFFSKLFH